MAQRGGCTNITPALGDTEQSRGCRDTGVCTPGNGPLRPEGVEMSAEKHRELKRVEINKNVSFQLSLMDRSAWGGLSDRWVYLEASWMDRIP